MDQKREIIFEGLCRLCMENAGAVEVFNTQDLVQDIYEFVTVKIAQQDQLPHKICTKCYDVIYNVKNLRSVATKNDLHLRSLFEDEDMEANESFMVISSCINEAAETYVFEDNEITIKEELTSFDESCDSSINDRLVIDESAGNDTLVTSSDLATSTRRNSTESIETSTENGRKRRRTEVGSDDLVCKVCRKKFDKPKKLYLHQRLHFKNIECPTEDCGKKFATKGDLQKHIRTHTGERPYKCEICGRSFSQKGSLKSHRDAVHGQPESILGR